MKIFKCNYCGFECTLTSKQTLNHDFKPEYCPMQNVQKSEWLVSNKPLNKEVEDRCSCAKPEFSYHPSNYGKCSNCGKPTNEHDLT